MFPYLASLTAKWTAPLLIGAAIAALWCSPLQAHQMNLSNAFITPHPDGSVDVTVTMKGSDVDRAAGTHVFDAQTGLVQPNALAAAASQIAAYVTTHAVILNQDGSLCQAGPSQTSPDQDGVVVRTRWTCNGANQELHYRSTILTAVSPSARQVVLIGGEKNPAQDLLDSERTEIAITHAPKATLLEVIGRYLTAGIEHIFLGYDHICFLLAIILWADRIWPVVKIVTAFTIAHSITLSLAALEIVRIPSSITEPAIAASIVYVAVENFVSRKVQTRWRNAFVFGLIHGFGFASALEEFGLPRGALVPALASFNVGVEIGQIGIVAIVLPVLLLLDRLFSLRLPIAFPQPAQAQAVYAGTLRPVQIVYPGSALIALFGTYWFLARTVLEGVIPNF